MQKKWRILLLVSFAEFLAEGIWFSFAPFTGAIGDEFGLSVGAIGLLVSSAIWVVPIGRISSGFFADKFGAKKVYSFLLLAIGLFSVSSAFVHSYSKFFALRIFVSLGGITLVVGMQHISQWFPESEYGIAEGIFAASGTLGAATGVLFLPMVFSNWQGLIFAQGFRAAFFFLGIIAIIYSFVYFLFTSDAKNIEDAKKVSQNASWRAMASTITQYGVLVLSLGYLLSYGLEAAMNSWLPTYFRVSFELSPVHAGALASIFPFIVVITRPFSGYVSDWMHKNEINLLPILKGKYRHQWTLLCMSYVVVMLALLGFAGSTGSVVLTVVAISQVALGSGFGSGAIFGIVPELYPDRSGTASGIVGGLGASGGILFPLLFAHTTSQGFPHLGYSLLAAILLPVIIIYALNFHKS